MRGLKYTLVLIVILGIAGAFLGFQWLQGEIVAPGPLAAEKLVYIPKTTVRGITNKLKEEGVIDNDTAFLLDARWQNRLAGLHAGEYQFTPRISIADVISLLQGGKTYQHKMTIAEGLTVAEVLDLLKKETALTGDVKTPPPEGSLLPETYKFSYGDTREGLVDRMKKEMSETVDSLWAKRAPDMPLSKEEAIVLASIVEKETGLAAERPRVAGVFFNRLHKSIPLQSDPTVIYALTLGEKPLGRLLTTDDLKKPSQYNTYVATGLPPGPIANPGKASLEAVMNPEKNEYIYFVADGSGGHAFAKTLQEHNRNVAHWRSLQK